MNTLRSDYLLVQAGDAGSPLLESYRSIRTSLSYAFFEQNHQILMFTSSIAGEGKTFTSANMGILTAMDGKRVLVVDGDLRQPHLHHLFGLPNRAGFSSILSGYSDLDRSIMPTSIPNLSLLPAGPIQPIPSELLGNHRLDAMFEECKRLYDVVFIDTPSLLSVADASILARVAQGIVLVVRSGYTKKEHIRRALKVIEPAKDKLIGTILNDKPDMSSLR